MIGHAGTVRPHDVTRRESLLCPPWQPVEHGQPRQSSRSNGPVGVVVMPRPNGVFCAGVAVAARVTGGVGLGCWILEVVTRGEPVLCRRRMLISMAVSTWLMPSR
jgi:hypothetical protein